MEQTTEKIFPSEKQKQLEQFIISMPLGIWYKTRSDPEVIKIIKEWIDGDYMWPNFYLIFSNDYMKFKKCEYII
jgi:hypothetical protein